MSDKDAKTNDTHAYHELWHQLFFVVSDPAEYVDWWLAVENYLYREAALLGYTSEDEVEEEYYSWVDAKTTWRDPEGEEEPDPHPLEEVFETYSMRQSSPGFSLDPLVTAESIAAEVVRRWGWVLLLLDVGEEEEFPPYDDSDFGEDDRYKSSYYPYLLEW